MPLVNAERLVADRRILDFMLCRVGLLGVVILVACGEQDGPPDGQECVGPRRLEPVELGPIGADEIPGWVDDRSTLVEDGPVPRCVPDDPSSDEQYGCLDGDGRCVPTSARVRVIDGLMVVSLGPTCANETMSEVPEFRVDGEPVAPNRIVWHTEVGIPVDAIAPGATIELWDTPCAYVTFRMRDWVEAEADDCGHEPFVNVEPDGDRLVRCRDEWRPFRADVGSDPGLLAHSRVDVSSADPLEGDTFTFGLNVGGCGPTELALVTESASTAPMICCADAAQRSLESTVGAGGQLEGFARPSSFGGCCYSAEPTDDSIDLSANCGGGDPGSW